MPQHIELNPVTHLTVGTVGEPGNRTFYLQGSHDIDQITLILEKVQTSALADSFESLLKELSEKFEDVSAELDTTIITDMSLRDPIDALFRVGNLGLGFNEDVLRIVLVAYELVEDEDDANMVSFWASPQQIQMLIEHSRQVVRGGRPICGNCGNPIEPDGHFCAHRNGYKR